MIRRSIHQHLSIDHGRSVEDDPLTNICRSTMVDSSIRRFVDQPTSICRSTVVDPWIQSGPSLHPPWLIRGSTAADPWIQHGRSVDAPTRTIVDPFIHPPTWLIDGAWVTEPLWWLIDHCGCTMVHPSIRRSVDPSIRRSIDQPTSTSIDHCPSVDAPLSIRGSTMVDPSRHPPETWSIRRSMVD